jgi:hypothetical protein
VSVPRKKERDLSQGTEEVFSYQGMQRVGKCQGSKTVPPSQGSAGVVRLKLSPALRVPRERALRREHLLNDVSTCDEPMNDLGDVELF